jgi:hypothetical protein
MLTYVYSKDDVHSPFVKPPWHGHITWRHLLEKFCILLWQARVGREIERYKREREEEMRKHNTIIEIH